MKNVELGNENGPRISDIMEEWLCKIHSEKKYSTYIKYKSICNIYLLPYIDGYFFSRISDRSIKEFSNTLLQSKKSKNTIKSVLSVTKQFLYYSNKTYDTPNFELEKNGFSNHEKVTDIFTHQEQKRLIDYLQKTDDIKKIGVFLSLFEGLRLGEICALEWQNIDFQNMTLSVKQTVQRLPASIPSDHKTALYISSPKSFSSKRTIPLSKHMYKILFSMEKTEGFLITGPAPLDPRTLQYFFRHCLEKAEIRVRNFHVLRHTFATNAIEGGMDVKVLSEILGHSDVQTTLNRYVHPSLDLKRTQLEKASNEIFPDI